MNDAAFRCLRERLGLTTAWLANDLGVAERSIHRWENGQSPVPDAIANRLREIEDHTTALLDQAVDALETMAGPLIFTFRTTEDYRRVHPDDIYPASWHRALIARAMDDVDGLDVIYWPGRVTDGSATFPVEIPPKML